MKTIKYLAIVVMLLAGTIGVRLAHGHKDHHVIFLQTRLTIESAFGNLPSFSDVTETPSGISNDMDDDSLDDDFLEDFCKLLFISGAFVLFAASLHALANSATLRFAPIGDVQGSRIVKLRRFRI